VAKKKQQMTLDAAKAVWEEYADIVLENFVDELEKVLLEGDLGMIEEVIAKMNAFKFDFNREIDHN